MICSFGLVFGWCGFGAGMGGGSYPNVRLGLLNLWCCWGSIFDRSARLHGALADAAAELGRNKR